MQAAVVETDIARGEKMNWKWIRNFVLAWLSVPALVLFLFWPAAVWPDHMPMAFLYWFWFLLLSGFAALIAETVTD